MKYLGLPVSQLVIVCLELRESKLEYRDGLEKPSNMLYNRFRVPALA